MQLSGRDILIAVASGQLERSANNDLGDVEPFYREILNLKGMEGSFVYPQRDGSPIAQCKRSIGFPVASGESGPHGRQEERNE
jgi:hypothetical protein